MTDEQLEIIRKTCREMAETTLMIREQATRVSTKANIIADAIERDRDGTACECDQSSKEAN